MRIPLGHRLFLAVLLSALAMAAVELALVRWKLFGSDAASTRELELASLEDLANTVSADYRVHQDWSFLPADAAGRKSWLRQTWGEAQPNRGADDRAPSPAPTFVYRIGLLDPDQRYLAGVIANPLVIAFASIDTFRRPVVVDGVEVGFLVVSRSQDPDEELAIAFLLDQQGNLLLVAAISVLLVALTATLLASHFRKPIRQLVDGARRLENAKFDTRIGLTRSDELGELAIAFNHLAARLEDTERSRQQWVADTSHELRTPLSVLRAQMEALQDGIRPATPDSIALMLRHVHSLSKLVDELYQLARADVGQLHYSKSSVDVWALLDQVLRGYAERFRLAGLTLTVGSAPARTSVHGDADRLGQVLTNLIENCVRYTDPGGRVEVSASVVGRELQIAIDDSAPGVPAAALQRLGERFFRVETSRNRGLGGAGLGLSLCQQIVKAHGGRLSFAPSALGGLRATLMLELEALS